MNAKYPFPFVRLSSTRAKWGEIPGDNFEEAVDECPTQFLGQNLWSEAAKTLYFNPDREIVIKRLTLKTEDTELAEVQRTYLSTWLLNERAVFDVKMSMCGWLLSLMLEEVPHFA